MGANTLSVSVSDCGARVFVRGLEVIGAQGSCPPSVSDFQRRDVRLVTKTATPNAPLSDLILHLELDALVRRGGAQRQAFRARPIYIS